MYTTTLPRSMGPHIVRVKDILPTHKEAVHIRLAARVTVAMAENEHTVHVHLPERSGMDNSNQ